MINCPGVERNRQEADDKKISRCLATGLDRPSNTLSAGWVSRSLWLSNSLLRLGVLNIKSLDHFSLGDRAGLLCGRVPAGGTALPAATADTSCGRAQLPASTPTRSRPRRPRPGRLPAAVGCAGSRCGPRCVGVAGSQPTDLRKGLQLFTAAAFHPAARLRSHQHQRRAVPGVSNAILREESSAPLTT